MKINSSLMKRNKRIFNTSSTNEKIILVEYNNFHGSHLCQALLANFFKNRNSSKIVAYFNYCVIVSPLELSFLQNLKWHISSMLSLGFKKIYKSFGVEHFIRPQITKEMTVKAINSIVTRPMNIAIPSKGPVSSSSIGELRTLRMPIKATKGSASRMT